MARESVPLDRPTPLAAEEQEPSVLPRAVVPEPRRLATTLEVGLSGVRLCEQASHGVELLRAMEMRRTGDGDLHVVEIRSHANQRQRLKGLGRAPEVGNERGVAARLDYFPAGYGDRVNAVPRLDYASPGRHDNDRLHGA